MQTAIQSARSESQQLRVHQALAMALVDNGINTLYGLIGDANLFMVDYFTRELGGRYIAASHEAGAVLMALGQANATGKVAVATVTHGPALVNTLTALVEGAKGHLPLLMLCGDTAVSNPEHLQNIDQRELILATGAGFHSLREPATAIEDFTEALRRAVTERRPIALNMPADFQWSSTSAPARRCYVPTSRAVVPDSEDLDNAVGIVAAARRPLILAGRGAADPASRDALLKLADRIGAPLATTLKAKDLFAGEDFNIGIMGTLSAAPAIDLIMEADTIIAFGCGLNQHTTSAGAFTRGKRIVHVHAQVTEIGRKQPVDVGLVGDPALTADKIRFWLDEAEIESSGFRNDSMRKTLRDFRLEPVLFPNRMAGTVDVREALLAIEKMLPPSRMLVTDGGRFLSEAWGTIPVRHPSSFVFTNNFGSIGLGMAQAIGAAVSHPDQTTVLVTGDGGFMLGGLTEFHAAIRNRLDLITIICNDGGYGAEHIQFRDREMDPALSILEWPDFGPVATAMGAVSVTVRCNDDLALVKDAIDRRAGPILIDLKLDPDCMPAVAGH